MGIIDWLMYHIFGELRCPKCGYRWISWNFSYEKWENCPKCNTNPNYEE